MKLSLVAASILSLSATANIIKYPHPSEIIVSYKSPSSSLINYGDSKIVHKNIHKISLHSFIDQKTIIEDLNNDPNINWAYPNYVYEGDLRELSPSDTQYSKQFHHQLIQSEKAWDLTLGKEEVVIAVTDDGFRLDHEDMLNSWWKNTGEVPDNGIDDDNNGYIDDVIGWDFNEEDNNPTSDDYNGSHGTHVAGIIAAGFDNGVGVSGMSPNLKVMPLKFFGKNSLTSEDYLKAYTYAVDNGAKIINTSYNIDYNVNDEVYLKALEYVYEQGGIVFNSAGNNSRFSAPREKLQNVVLVASSVATNSLTSRKSRFSNYGYGVDLMAPGDPILSLSRNGGYVNMSGTSMASPVAAAVAGYIWSENPDYTREQVLHTLLVGADNVDEDNSKYRNKLGAGRVNTYNSIKDSNHVGTISNIFFDKKVSEIKIQIKGIIDIEKSDLLKAFTLSKGEGNIEMKIYEDYQYGMNVISFGVPKDKGKYELSINSEYLIDVFGNEMTRELGDIFSYKIGWFF